MSFSCVSINAEMPGLLQFPINSSSHPGSLILHSLIKYILHQSHLTLMTNPYPLTPKYIYREMPDLSNSIADSALALM